MIAERSGTTIVYSLNVAAYEEIAAALISFFQVGSDQRRPMAKHAQKEGLV